MEDIHAIRPPVMVGMDPETVRIMAVAAIAIAAIVGLFFVIRYFLRRRKQVQDIVSIPVMSPIEAALGELDRLALLPAHKTRQFYFDLSRVIKAYISQSFHIHCLEMTTQELVRTVRQLDMPRELADRITRFQDISDPFRYAPVTPSQDQKKNDLNQATALIRAMDAYLNPDAAPQDVNAPAVTASVPGVSGPDKIGTSRSKALAVKGGQ